MTIEVGQTLGHYRLTEKLGEGGMGEVYRAQDTTLDREVALKVLPAALADDPERLARFEREAKTLAALDHPNIVHIYSVESGTVEDASESEPRTFRFLTMQLVEGRPLSELIPVGGMPLERIFDLGIPLSEALAAAHEKGIVHRDLKPANIMVTEEGRVKVLDFGLAKLQQIGGAVDTTEAPTEMLTGEGKILGTMPYMSPEQLEGTDLDARSDIFSLGILLYEMSTGTRPFQGDTSVSLISSIVKDTPPSVDTVRDELPHHLARIVNRCLDKSPKRRYQSAIDVENELAVLRREVESGIVTSGISRPTSAEIDAARSSAPQSAETSTGRRWWPIAVGAVILAIAAIAFWMSRASESGPGASEGIATETASKADAPGADLSATSDVPAIVVLPFQNRGDSEDEYFADGMSEEITTRLAGISGLRVISSSSAMQYKENRPPLKQIAEELAVDYVLDGSVRWAKENDGSRVRITPQLVRTSDDTQLWAESYDRVMEDVFDMQEEIATAVVAQLGVTLLEPEREELEARSTENLEAYQAYLRGSHGQGTADYTEPTQRRIVEDFQAAVELDPDFALAWASLAHAHSFYYRLGYDFTEARGEMARQAYNQALSLDPSSPEVLYELGYYHYYIEEDYDAALEKFLTASAALPNDSEIMAAAAFVWRRQGKMAEAMERLEQAFELSPRNAIHPALICEFAMMMRDFPKAIDACDASINLAPDEFWPYVQKAISIWLWNGDLTEPRRIVDSFPRSNDTSTIYPVVESDLLRLSRDFDALEEEMRRAPFEWLNHQPWSLPKSLIVAEALAFQGDTEGARAEYEMALTAIEQALSERPNDYRLYSSLGMTQAGLGHKEEAIAASQKALEMMPIEKDVYIGHQMVVDFALTYTRLGMAAEALDQIDLVLSIPAKFSVEGLKLDPRWDTLRDHPRYQEILEKYS